MDHWKVSFKSKEIIAIIRTCRAQGVSSFQHGDLHICFGTPAIEKSTNPAEPPAIGTEGEIARIETEGLIQEEIKVKDDELATMLIEDPARYEELLSEGDLTDEVADDR